MNSKARTWLNAERPQESADVRVAAKPTGHGIKSETVREKAILALLSENSLARAARRCGVNEKTLRRWLADDEEFKSQLSEGRRLMFEAGMNRVQALTLEAIRTLAALMGPRIAPAVRLGAARTVVELGIHQHDADTIMKKLNELEVYQRQQDDQDRRR